MCEMLRLEKVMKRSLSPNLSAPYANRVRNQRRCVTHILFYSRKKLRIPNLSLEEMENKLRETEVRLNGKKNPSWRNIWDAKNYD